MAPPGDGRVAIVTVNYNTALLISLLLFSVFRVLGRSQVARVVVVDNGSTDGSLPLLRALAEAGLVDLVTNRQQRYHGPALNQAMSHLGRIRRTSRRSRDAFDHVWILDSDVIVLKPGTYVAAAAYLESRRAAVVGEFQYDALPEGYAHVSSLLLNPRAVWRRPITPFEESGAPGSAMQTSLRRRGLKVSNFPFRSEGFILHLGRGTLREIARRHEQNRYSAWASEHSAYHYHGNPGGALILEQALERFRAEVPDLTPDALVRACLDPDSLDLSVLG